MISRNAIKGIAVALVVLVACTKTEGSDKKQTVAAQPSAADGRVMARATEEARAVCGANFQPRIEQADFDGDGAMDVVADWSGAACMRTPAACSQSEGCTRSVWRETADGPIRIYSGTARAASVFQGPPARLVLDHGGATCGRPANETCRVTYVWDARVRALQEREREVVAATPIASGGAS